jgi:hypothetical protein
MHLVTLHSKLNCTKIVQKRAVSLYPISYPDGTLTRLG